jgi:hypothetical protein
MLIRIRISLALAVFLSLLLPTSALAKGSFAFITVSGENLGSEVRLSQSNLTTDWFAFADFQSEAVPAPKNSPQGGYVITRYYVDEGRESAFDVLHYYPAAGLVYYDGLTGGHSMYDEKWYAARPEIMAAFQTEVATASVQEAARHTLFLRRS